MSVLIDLRALKLPIRHVFCYRDKSHNSQAWFCYDAGVDAYANQISRAEFKEYSRPQEVFNK